MGIVILTKEETLKLIYNSMKNEYHENRYSFVVKFPAKCLKCLNPIFISYKQFGINSIFCDNCKSKSEHRGSEKLKIVQYNYMRVIKEKQLKQIESFFDKIKI